MSSNSSGIGIRALAFGDWPQVRVIYEEGIATGDATFETEAPDWEQWDSEHLPECRLVAVVSDRVIGWAALCPISDRCAYAGVAEVSVYVGTDSQGRGVGTLLLQTLITRSEQSGLWTLQAGIFPENEGSILVHERCGFRIVGRRVHLGRLAGRWRDVLMLERRSGTVGIAEEDAKRLPSLEL